MAKFKITKQDVVETIKKRWWIMLIELAVIGVILLFDLLTKKYAVEFLSTQHGWKHPFIEGFISLTYTENTGAGFGMFSGNTTALTVITALVIVAIIVYLIIAQKESMWLRVSLLFIVGGGIGNLVDRIGLGYVRDFIKFDFWESFAIFNIADSFVTVGVFMLIAVLIVMLVKEGKKNKKAFEEEQAGKPAETHADPLDAPIPLNPMMESVNEYTFEEVRSDSENARETANSETETPQTDEALNGDGQSVADEGETEGDTQEALGEGEPSESAQNVDENSARDEIPSESNSEQDGSDAE